VELVVRMLGHGSPVLDVGSNLANRRFVSHAGSVSGSSTITGIWRCDAHCA
jgi:hypothetical protein